MVDMMERRNTWAAPEYPEGGGVAAQNGPAPIPTLQARLRQFPGDQAIGASADVFVDVQAVMGDLANGFLLLSVVGTVQVSINGQGYRTVPTSMAYTNIVLQNLRIKTGPGSSCILQLQGL